MVPIHLDITCYCRSFLVWKAAQTLAHVAPWALPHINPTKISPANTSPTAGRLAYAQVNIPDPIYIKYIAYYIIAPKARASHRINIPTISPGTCLD